MQYLLENRVYVMAEKYEFHSSSATFLGYILAGGQVNTDPVKIRWSGPHTPPRKCFNDSSAAYGETGIGGVAALAGRGRASIYYLD